MTNDNTFPTEPTKIVVLTAAVGVEISTIDPDSVNKAIEELRNILDREGYEIQTVHCSWQQSFGEPA